MEELTFEDIEKFRGRVMGLLAGRRFSYKDTEGKTRRSQCLQLAGGINVLGNGSKGFTLNIGRRANGRTLCPRPLIATFAPKGGQQPRTISKGTYRTWYELTTKKLVVKMEYLHASRAGEKKTIEFTVTS